MAYSSFFTLWLPVDVSLSNPPLPSYMVKSSAHEIQFFLVSNFLFKVVVVSVSVYKYIHISCARSNTKIYCHQTQHGTISTTVFDRHRVLSFKSFYCPSLFSLHSYIFFTPHPQKRTKYHYFSLPSLYPPLPTPFLPFLRVTTKQFEQSKVSNFPLKKTSLLFPLHTRFNIVSIVSCLR